LRGSRATAATDHTYRPPTYTAAAAVVIGLLRRRRKRRAQICDVNCAVQVEDYTAYNQ